MGSFFDREDREIKTVIQTAGPVLVELFLGTLFGMVDMMMLGRIADQGEAAASIAAVGITNQLIFITLSLVQALNVGGTAMVARYVGAKRKDEVEDVIKHIVLLTQVLIVIPVLIFGLKYSTSIMKFLGAHGDTIEYGGSYFKVLVMGLVFQAFNFSIYAVLRGSGDTKTPMGINLRVNFLNVIGNAILIYGLFGLPKLGVTGAGISTVISQIVASILIVIKIVKRETIIDLKPGFKFNPNIMFNLVKIGIPASLEQIAVRVGLLMFTRIVSSLGTVAYATHQICLNILSLSFTPGQALGIASSSLTGRSLGAEKPEKAEEYIDVCEKIGMMMSAAMALLFFFLGKYIAMLYTQNTEVIAMATKLLRIIALVQPFQTSQMILSGGLRGAGDTIWPLIAMFVSILIIRVALAWLFIMKMGMGLEGAWIAMFIDQAIRWSMIKLRYRTGKWKHVTLR